MARNSNCSAGVPVRWYWWSCPGDGLAENVEASVEATWQALQKPGRRWNPFSRSLARAEVRRRIENAANGRLAAVAEVKPVGEEPFFEIRWQGIAVADQIADQLVFSDALLRLIYAEPVEMGLAAVGLHAFEKKVFEVPRETRQAQENEIELAKRIYSAGYGDFWGHKV